PAPRHHAGEDLADLVGRHAPPRLERQAFSRELINETQPFQAPAVAGPIEEEVPGPDVILAARRPQVAAVDVLAVGPPPPGGVPRAGHAPPPPAAGGGGPLSCGPPAPPAAAAPRSVGSRIADARRPAPRSAAPAPRPHRAAWGRSASRSDPRPGRDRRGA